MKSALGSRDRKTCAVRPTHLILKLFAPCLFLLQLGILAGLNNAFFQARAHRTLDNWNITSRALLVFDAASHISAFVFTLPTTTLGLRRSAGWRPVLKSLIKLHLALLSERAGHAL